MFITKVDVTIKAAQVHLYVTQATCWILGVTLPASNVLIVVRSRTTATADQQMSLGVAPRILLQESAQHVAVSLLIVISSSTKAGATPRTTFSDGPYAQQPLAGCVPLAMGHRVTLQWLLHVVDAMTHHLMESRTVPRALRDPMDHFCAPVATIVSLQPWMGHLVSNHVLRKQHLTVIMVFVLASAARGHILVALAVCSATQHAQSVRVLGPVIA